MEQRVFEYIEKQHMLTQIDRVVVGVSGGADSVCLLLLLNDYRQLARKAFELLAVHVNHKIRGAEAQRDEEFVTDLCRRMDIALQVVSVDVPALAKERRMSLEEAGRAARYQAFAKASDGKCSAVAVAHHMEDQAETVLFRIGRGTGVDGIAGMRPVVKADKQTPYRIIRPLLCLHRTDIERILDECQMSYVTDSTNEDTRYQRNYVRHELLPRMAQVNERAVEHICVLSRQAAELSDYVESEVERLFATQVWQECDACGRKTGYFRVSAAWLSSRHRYVQSALLRRMLAAVSGQMRDITAQHIDLLLELLWDAALKRVQLPYQMEGFISSEWFYVGNFKKGEKKCENLVKYFHFEPISLQNGVDLSKKNYTKIIDYDTIKIGLTMRYAQATDYIVIDSCGHRKSLHKFFVDEKVPRHMRERIPLVCSGEEVVWIVGYRLNARCYVTEQSARGLQIAFAPQMQDNLLESSVDEGTR